MTETPPKTPEAWLTAQECAAMLKVTVAWLYGSDVPYVPLPTTSRKGAEPRIMRRYLPSEVEAWARAKRYELLGVGEPQGKAG